MSDVNQPPPPPNLPPPPPPNLPPPPPGPGQPPVPGASGPPSGPKNWMGVTGIVASILGIVGSCCWGIGFIPGAAGLVLGMLGRKAADAGEATNRSLAQAAFVMGIIALVINVLGFVSTLVSIFWPQTFNVFGDFL